MRTLRGVSFRPATSTTVALPILRMVFCQSFLWHLNQISGQDQVRVVHHISYLCKKVRQYLLFGDGKFYIIFFLNNLNIFIDDAIIILLLLPCSQAVRHQTLTLTRVSSNLTRATKRKKQPYKGLYFRYGYLLQELHLFWLHPLPQNRTKNISNITIIIQ